MKIDYANVADARNIEILWQEAFDDDQDDIRSFLSCFLGRDTALVVRDHNSIEAMLFLIETKLRFCEQERTVGYIYAGATKKSERGKGLYKRLLAAAEEEAVKRGMTAIFLQPADESLERTYARYGFTVPLYVHVTKGKMLEEATAYTSVSPAEYQAIRRQMLLEARLPFIDWPIEWYEHCTRWYDAAVTENGTVLLGEQGIIMEKIERTLKQNLYPLGQMKLLTDADIDDQACLYMGYAMD